MKAADELRKGDTLGRYEIIERIAVGGMAEIYLGRVRGTAGFDKLVAIKRILPFVAQDGSFVEMFLAEARLAATLRHPNIADVFDVGIEAGSYFFAMEFIHGQDLRAICIQAKRSVSLEIALAVVGGIASALAYAHTKSGPNGPLNLVHRDISPSNIIVSFDGAVKLVDFGIARAETNPRSTITRTGQLKGKIPYMSPEQCRAKPMDGRADLFSLGIVLYELTTGVRPFDGRGDFDTLERIVHGNLRLPSEVVASYPRALEAILMRMLANKRSARYQTAAELVHDLERLTADHGWFASAFVVGRYMRELFPEEANKLPHMEDEEDPPTLTPGVEIDILDPSPDTVRFVEADATSGLFGLEAETARVSHEVMHTRPSDEFKVVFRAPTGPPAYRPESASPFFEESTTRSHVGDVTHTNFFAPFDPVATRAADMLASIDPNIVDERDISLTTIGELLHRALAWTEAGHIEEAVIALDLILSADRTTPGVLDLFAKNFPFMTAIFESFLGDRSRIPTLSQDAEVIANMSLDRRAAYLLSMMLDSSLSAAELLDRADMPIIEAYRHLSNLILRRVVVLV